MTDNEAIELIYKALDGEEWSADTLEEIGRIVGLTGRVIHSSDPPNIIARFNPQAWIRDYAVDVDPEGDTEWNVTEAFYALPDDYRDRLVQEMTYDGEALDSDDALQSDPNAPEWVREWHGPFSLWVRVDD